MTIRDLSNTMGPILNSVDNLIDNRAITEQTLNQTIVARHTQVNKRHLFGGREGGKINSILAIFREELIRNLMKALRSL